MRDDAWGTPCPRILARLHRTPTIAMTHHCRANLVSFASLVLLAACAGDAEAAQPASQPSLYATIATLDAQMFDAFNRCSDPAQLQRHATFFDANVEFYHDKGGVTWTRDAMIDRTRQYVCGQLRRELVAGTLRVYPIKDFGAIETGTHRFCAFNSAQCDGIADFAIVWRQQGDRWQITRVLSYGHHAIEEGR